MKLQFKQQQFQFDAAKAVCDIFAGQLKKEAFKYILDPGKESGQQLQLGRNAFANNYIQISKEDIWERIHKKQTSLGLKSTGSCKDDISLTIEMETGTGKTYTYIKTIYELNALYGWSKFIIVVPSVAIREGVKKTFEITREHFKQEYGKSIIEFVYNSSNLNEIEAFATDNKIRVMIINSQAFAASLKEDGRSKESRVIFTEQDSFKGRRPIDVIAKTNPILILDEPQSLGKSVDTTTQRSLKLFESLFRLSYSATPPELNKNIIYRLDAQDAYNKKLVKKISVKGISISGNSANSGYLYFIGIDVYNDKAPTAKLEFDFKGVNSISKKVKICVEGDNLYDLSGNLDQYRDNWLITKIDGRTNSITLQNGMELYAGDVVGNANEEQIRRIQIRETIISHFERERVLFEKGIKVLSLFFIDEVAKYRLADDGREANGIYAKIFEEEYNNIKNELLSKLPFDEKYYDFIKATDADSCHKGYFSVDKKSGKFKDSEIKRGTMGSDDIAAYDLIMKNKERLLDRKEPVRFLFSHSALKEGWDNPNVFQICTLKNSSNDDKRRQEIGRGLRLSVNQCGNRMDESFLNNEVHDVNVLTVIANESYETFVSELQKDIAKTMSERPRTITAELFKGKIIANESVGDNEARKIYFSLIKNDYIDNTGILTEKYHNDVENGEFKTPEGFEAKDIIALVDTIYKPIKLENARDNMVELKLDEQKLSRKEFQDLWNKINIKSSYNVSFNSDEIVKKSIASLNSNLKVSRLVATIKSGEMLSIKSKQDLEEGTNFKAINSQTQTINMNGLGVVKYDLLDKLVQGTGLTRTTLTQIMQSIQPDVFALFAQNPEEFILKSCMIINEQKATAIVEHIQYNRLKSSYDINIFTEPKLKGACANATATPKKHIYNYAIADSSSKPEKNMAINLDNSNDVCVYAKLPRGFYISTPVGKYNPDWAIAFNNENVKHIYFVAETKGSMDSLSLELRGVENAKIACAKKHFAAISSDNVKYEVVDSYENLMKLVG